MIQWIKRLFTKKEKEPFEKFLKELVEERREAKYPINKGTRSSGAKFLNE